MCATRSRAQSSRSPTRARHVRSASLPDADLRTDLPRYRVFRDGKLVDEPTDVTRFWRDDLVGFLLGCSFTFEWALAAAGSVPCPSGAGGSTSRCTSPTAAAASAPARFEGPLVVSMRPFAPRDIPHAVEGVGAVSSDELGAPGARRRTRRRSASQIWALRTSATRCGSGCGRGAGLLGMRGDAAGRRPRGPRPSLAIFHSPGHMFITDRPHADFDCEEQGHAYRLTRYATRIERRCGGNPQAVRGAAIGNAVEWFDFAIYGFLATYIAAKFFPSGDDTAALSGFGNPANSTGRASPQRVAVASFIGTTVEFYDFLIYGTAAALVFPKLFFPNTSPAVGVLLSFATFGVGFFARPLGGMVFGHFGDRIGRKRMLVYSLLGMGISTVLMGLLPT